MQETSTNFTISMAELALIAGDIAGYMTRDAAEFASRGIDAAAITAFETQIDDFEALPSDAFYRGEISIAVQEKEALRTQVLMDMQLISGFFEQKWGLESPQYKQLEMKGIHHVKDSQFYLLAKRMVATAVLRLIQLTPEGMTQAMIDQLSTNAQLFEDQLHQVALQEAEREIKTQERTQAANALYQQLQQYCRVGKLIWENVDAAKYEDYEIHKSVTHGLPKAQNLMAVNAGNNIADLSWDPVVGATEYRVDKAEASTGQPQGPWEEYITTTDAFTSAPLLPGFSYWYRVRGQNATETGYWSDEASITG